MPIYCKLDAIVSVVDTLRMVDEFGSGSSLIKKDIDEEDIENLVIQQIEFCDILIMNKVDEVEKEELERVRQIIKNLQPKAKLIETNYSKVDISEILDTNLFDMENVLTSAGWFQEIEKDAEESDKHHDHHHAHEHNHEHKHHGHDHHEHEEEHEKHHHHEHNDNHSCHCHEHDHEDCDCETDEHGHKHHHCHCHCHNHEHGETEEYGIGTFVYFRRKPFDRLKFEDFVAKDWGKQIIRTKGLVYFSNEYDMSYIYEQAGRQKQLTENGPWYATLPKEQIQQFLIHDEKFRKDWDDTYGDRMIKLVFIGQKLDKHKIIEELNKI